MVSLFLDSTGVHPKPTRQVSTEVQSVVNEFNGFLQTLPKPIQADIAQKVQVVADKLLNYSAEDCSVEELSKIANNFYEDFGERLNRHDLYAGKFLWRGIFSSFLFFSFFSSFFSLEHNFPIHFLIGLGEETITKIVNYIESYILVRSYKNLFCPPTTDDEDKDLLMQNRVRKLNWVTALRLGAIVDEVNPEVRESMDAAITGTIRTRNNYIVMTILS